ncbi:unnamed protein product, partial [Rotaria magnacalcarata]
MKIIFEHAGRKTPIFGDDYATIINKISLLLPGENSRTIQFYDPELSDYFDFTSFQQVKDQINGLEKAFDASVVSDSLVLDPLSSPIITDNQNNQRSKNVKTSNSARRSRKRWLLQIERIEPPTLPTYCDIIVQGLKSR